MALRLNLGNNISLKAYADDFLLIAIGENKNIWGEKLTKPYAFLWTGVENIDSISIQQIIILTKCQRIRSYVTVIVIDKIIHRSKLTSYLGVKIDQNLTWKPHTENIDVKVQTITNRLRGYFRKMFSKQVLLFLKRRWCTATPPTLCHPFLADLPPMKHKFDAGLKMYEFKNGKTIKLNCQIFKNKYIDRLQTSRWVSLCKSQINKYKDIE